MRLIHVLHIFLLAALSGCLVSFQPSNSYTFDASGKEGVVLSFADNLPPDKVWQHSGLHVGLEIRNRGTSDVVDGLISIQGFDTKLVQGLYVEGSEENRFSLEGRSEINLNGGYEYKEYETYNIRFPDSETNFYDVPIKVVACYPYYTVANIPVCIDTIPAGGVKTDQTCYISDKKISKGQGAPIAVTYVNEYVTETQDPSIVDVTFEIKIENEGDGEVFDIGKYDMPCLASKYTSEDLWNNKGWVYPKVFVSDFEITDTCKPVDDVLMVPRIRLYNDEAVFVCTYSVPKEKDAHESVLRIVLEYGYSNSIQKKVEIVRSLES
ncbi:hypothetical protein D6745_02555 [Candidatus Woesearchaeota archaeon]|nr:MAG: hypothetical protein D6745_02555 [Candidatus Woesearchaeota archaeon]